MKKRQRNIFYARVLLLFFAVGQYIVFTHTHARQAKTFSVVKSTSAATVKENCDICDAMHHTHAVLSYHVYFAPPVAIKFHYQFKQSQVTLIQLVLASGRAPPVAIS